MKTAFFERFEFNVPDGAVVDIPKPGLSDAAVAHYLPHVPLWPAANLIRDELRDYGAWDDDELADDGANRERLLWIAACNIAEGDYELPPAALPQRP